MEDVSLTAKFITPRISGCVRLNYTLTSGYKDAFLRQTFALNCVSTVCLACICCCGSTCGQVLGEIHVSSDRCLVTAPGHLV